MGTLSRRRFLQDSLILASLGLLAGCGVLSPWAPAAPKIPRIGYLVLRPVGALSPPEEAFRDSLREQGYVEGQTIAIEWRLADREERLADLASELVGLGVELIFAGGTQAVQATQAVTRTLPIITVVSDPVGTGLVASLARPGGNVTGLTTYNPQLSAKRLAVLQEAVPAVSRVAALWNPADPPRVIEYKETQAAAAQLGLQLQSFELRSPDDFDRAFATAAAWPADAAVVLPDPLTRNYRKQMMERAAEARLPTMTGDSVFTEAGGLLAYGPNQLKMFRRAATYVDKVLKGANPADLPMEQPMTFDFVVNLKTAQALGLTIPQSVLQQATEFIQ